MKFTQSGAITIVVQEPEPQSSQWAFIVSDTGAGMDAKRVEGIFDRFGQSAQDSLGRAVGAGLGLSITRDLVEAMNGRIEVESELGQGTSISISLPLGDPPEQTDGPTAELTSGSVALLVDRASDHIQAEALATKFGYWVCDLEPNTDLGALSAMGLTVIADADLLPKLSEDVVAASQRIIVLGNGSSAETKALGGKGVYVSHHQLTRSLSELLEEQDG